MRRTPNRRSRFASPQRAEHFLQQCGYKLPAFVYNSLMSRLCVMSDGTQRLVADLEAIAASIRDPARREAVRRIIARLAHQGQEWPDDAELMRIRLKYSDSAN